MSVYEPLKRHLSATDASELRMSFAEIEALLGRPLPASARRHPSWWSNNVGTHVNAMAWRNAGWRTARVNIADEHVTFLRDAPVRDYRFAEASSAGVYPSVAEPAAAWWGDAVLTASRPAGRRLIEGWMEARGVDAGAAVVEILDALGKAQQEDLVRALPTVQMPKGHDSTTLIREDRDAR